MLKKQSDHALEYLEGKKATGFNWLTFDGITFPTNVSSLRTFASAIDATRYCTATLFNRYQDSRVPGFGDSVYASIDNTIAEIRFSQSGKLELATPMSNLQKLMEEEDFHFIKHHANRHLLTLAVGGVAMASRHIPIRPLDHIDSYVVLEQIVTKGHGIPNEGNSKIVEHHVGTDLAVAFRAYSHQSLKMLSGPSSAARKTILFGRLKDNNLEYNPELYLIRDTGIQIAASSCSPGKSASVGPIDLKEIHIHSQSFFVQYNPDRNVLQTLDDRLIPVTLDQRITSFGGDEFTPAIKNAMHKAMGQIYSPQAPRHLGNDENSQALGKSH